MRTRDRLSCTFHIRSHLDELDPLWAEVEAELLIWVALSERTRSDFRLALTEAVANAILHAHGEDGRPLDVEVVIERGRLEARVHDSGPGFVLTESDATRRAPPLETGRGLGLVQALAADVRYSRDAASNELSFALAVDWPSTRDLS
jgi:anti-sigma regulatory factor (Ser/Thr protein kinase)